MIRIFWSVSLFLFFSFLFSCWIFFHLAQSAKTTNLKDTYALPFTTTRCVQDVTGSVEGTLMILYFNNLTTLKASEWKRSARLKSLLQDKLRPAGFYTLACLARRYVATGLCARWKEEINKDAVWMVWGENKGRVSWPLWPWEDPPSRSLQPGLNSRRRRKTSWRWATFTSRHIYCTWTR